MTRVLPATRFKPSRVICIRFTVWSCHPDEHRYNGDLQTCREHHWSSINPRFAINNNGIPHELDANWRSSSRRASEREVKNARKKEESFSIWFYYYKCWPRFSDWTNKLCELKMQILWLRMFDAYFALDATQTRVALAIERNQSQWVEFSMVTSNPLITHHFQTHRKMVRLVCLFSMRHSSNWPSVKWQSWKVALLRIKANSMVSQSPTKSVAL